MVRIQKKHRFMINYLATNENLNAIIKGMDLKSDDRILSIMGSLDQAAAMTEYLPKGQITCVDSWEAQYDLAKYRLEHLKQGNFDAFLMKSIQIPFAINGQAYFTNLRESNLENIRKRNEYFEKDNKLKRIQKNSYNIKLIDKKMSILDCDGYDYNKIYLSNALDIGLDLTRLLSGIPIGGLLYHSNEIVSSQFNLKLESGIAMQKDEKLTKKAQEREGWDWNPVVYKRIS